jgi:hypothetical protein
MWDTGGLTLKPAELGAVREGRIAVPAPVVAAKTPIGKAIDDYRVPAPTGNRAYLTYRLTLDTLLRNAQKKCRGCDP